MNSQPKRLPNRFAEWAAEALADLERFAGLLIGPGLGSDPHTRRSSKTIEHAPVPVIIDADGLTAVATHPQCIKNRRHPTVLTSTTENSKTYRRASNQRPMR